MIFVKLQNLINIVNNLLININIYSLFTTLLKFCIITRVKTSKEILPFNTFQVDLALKKFTF